MTPRIRLSLPQGVQAWLELPGSSLSTSNSYSSARSGTSGEEKRQGKKKEKKKEKRGWNCSRLLGFDVSPTTSTVPVLLWPDVGRTRARKLAGELNSISKLPFPFSYSSKNGLWCQQSHCGWLHDFKGRPTLPVEARIVATPPQHSNAGKSTYIVSSSRGAHLPLSLLLRVFFFSPFLKMKKKGKRKQPTCLPPPPPPAISLPLHGQLPVHGEGKKWEGKYSSKPKRGRRKMISCSTLFFLSKTDR